MGRAKTTFEYADNWRLTCRRGLRLMPFCTCNPFHGRAVYVHHVKYSRSPLRRLLGIFLFHLPKKSVSGFEIIGYDAFPVCEKCHHNGYGRSTQSSSLHYTGGAKRPNPKAGKYGEPAEIEEPPKWKQLSGLDSHNVASVAWRLRIKFCFWVIVLHLGRAIIKLFKRRKI
ncbi:MAG: hypothetical protein RMY36_032465 [Nostoc sp. SerVER01]|nr:hypothetical protein [Nostoc sp. SerVER01]